MHRRSIGYTIGLALTVLALVMTPNHVAAQTFPYFGAIDVRIGAVKPDQASTGFGWSADIDAGYIKTPRLRVIVGASRFGADVQRQVSGVPVGGSISSVGGRVGLRYDAFGVRRIAPYAVASLSGHNVSADVADAGTKQLLEGFYAGVDLGGGISFALDTAARFSATTEVRRVYVTNVSHWAYELGMRWTPQGRRAYTNVARQAREAQALIEQRARLAAERARTTERLRLEAAQRDTSERSRLDAVERARRDSVERTQQVALTQQRLASAQRDSVERARTDAAQQQAQQQILALRARTDSLEAVSRAEAAARATAEAEANAARARAATAEAAALDAERKRYRAVLDLNRLISDVTEIKETDRGLTIVLGQGLFASGQYRLSERARTQLGTIAAVLAQYQERRIAVEGHTDAAGGELANQRLSEGRAEAVRAALIARGVAPSRIDMAGYGEGTPVATNDTAAGRAQNRRVELIILGVRRPVEP